MARHNVGNGNVFGRVEVEGAVERICVSLFLWKTREWTAQKACGRSGFAAVCDPLEPMWI